jgi:hypothetical protein
MAKNISIQSASSSTAEVQAATATLLEGIAIRLSEKCNTLLLASDIRDALTLAVSEALDPVGGVVLVWYDPRQGLKINVGKWTVESADVEEKYEEK